MMNALTILSSEEKKLRQKKLLEVQDRILNNVSMQVMIQNRIKELKFEEINKMHLIIKIQKLKTHKMISLD